MTREMSQQNGILLPRPRPQRGEVKLLCSGKAGEQVTAQAECPFFVFRAERLIATDTCKDASIVVSGQVGKHTRQYNLPTTKFAATEKSGTLHWRPVRKGDKIVFTIEFKEEGTWSASLLGTVLEPPHLPGRALEAAK